MSFLFRKGKTSPEELVSGTIESITTLASSPEDEKAVERLSTCLAEMKLILYGEPENDPKPELIDKLVKSILSKELIAVMVKNIGVFQFEGKKDVAAVVNFLIRRGTHNMTIVHLEERPEALDLCMRGYEDADVALVLGSILRECVRHEVLCRMILEGPHFYDFFEFVQKSNFDVASDAFQTFKLVLTTHKALIADFLSKNYDQFFDKYNELVQSDNYVTKRQSLKLLGEILLDRKNFNVMMKYINDADNLKILMNLLRGPSKMIQFEAFHVFKVFVANPQKSQPIMDILMRNREKLIEFLRNFQREKEDDEQFVEEKNILLRTLGSLGEDASN